MLKLIDEILHQFRICFKREETWTLIMRGKASSIGFELPKQAQKSRRGRPRKYGDKVILSNLFDKIKGLFTAATINLYGKEESVEYLYKDLLWKPVGRILRFVMVKTSNNLSSITKDKDKEKTRNSSL